MFFSFLVDAVFVYCLPFVLLLLYSHFQFFLGTKNWANPKGSRIYKILCRFYHIFRYVFVGYCCRYSYALYERSKT